MSRDNNESAGPWVVLHGDLGYGFDAVGPFGSREEADAAAAEYLGNVGGHALALPLSPAADDDGAVACESSGPTNAGPTPGPMYPMTAGTMPNGQPCIRVPRGLVATMEAGSDAVRESDAVEIARRWNAYPDLYAALREVQSALACDRDGIPYVHPVHGRITLEEVKYTVVDTALSRAEGGAK